MKQSVLQTFAWPLALLLATMIGLIVGLLADGWWDWMAMTSLAIPLAIISALICIMRGGRRK
jgi:uncharacterized ion transporter superfamily protein YfcC